MVLSDCLLTHKILDIIFPSGLGRWNENRPNQGPYYLLTLDNLMEHKECSLSTWWFWFCSSLLESFRTVNSETHMNCWSLSCSSLFSRSLEFDQIYLSCQQVPHDISCRSLQLLSRYRRPPDCLLASQSFKPFHIFFCDLSDTILLFFFITKAFKELLNLGTD